MGVIYELWYGFYGSIRPASVEEDPKVMLDEVFQTVVRDARCGTFLPMRLYRVDEHANRKQLLTTFVFPGAYNFTNEGTYKDTSPAFSGTYEHLQLDPSGVANTIPSIFSSMGKQMGEREYSARMVEQSSEALSWAQWEEMMRRDTELLLSNNTAGALLLSVGNRRVSGMPPISPSVKEPFGTTPHEPRLFIACGDFWRHSAQDELDRQGVWSWRHGAPINMVVAYYTANQDKSADILDTTSSPRIGES